MQNNATLLNGKKVQSFRLQVVEKYFRVNYTVCLHCRKSNKNDSKGIANFLKETKCEIPGKDLTSILGMQSMIEIHWRFLSTLMILRHVARTIVIKFVDQVFVSWLSLELKF